MSEARKALRRIISYNTEPSYGFESLYGTAYNDEDEEEEVELYEGGGIAINVKVDPDKIEEFMSDNPFYMISGDVQTGTLNVGGHIEEIDKIAMHKQICDRMNEIYTAKNHDYGDSFGESYKVFGEVAGIVRISDKFNRVVQLSQSNEQKVQDEKIEDTLLDMANYCIMQLIEMEIEKKKGA